MLDGEIGDALSRVELVRLGDRARGAGVDTSRASAAAIDRGLIGWEIERRDHFTEEQPRTDVGIDDAGVFAKPADSRAGGELLFHHRSSVDTGARLRFRRKLSKKIRK